MDDDLLARIVLLAAAIFHAEGFWVPSSLPRRHHNPGDILDPTGVNNHYDNAIAGVDHAARQLEMMLVGRSHVYHYAMTWRRVAQLWTGGDNAAAWCASVCDDLGVSPDSTLGQFAGVTPKPPSASPTLPETPPAPARES